MNVGAVSPARGDSFALSTVAEVRLGFTSLGRTASNACTVKEGVQWGNPGFPHD
jgi:hypothetical protein